MVATGITANYSRVVVLRSERFSGDTEPDSIGKAFSLFAHSIKDSFGKIDYVYCDKKEKFLYRTIRDRCDNEMLNATVRIAADEDVTNRIRLTSMLASQGRLFLSEDCDVLSRALSEAVWAESKKADSRSDSSDIGTLNAFEYTLEREAARFVNG